ncbi:hypothetical protein ACIGBH_11605 [Streptomyces sp. NPDC085929]|uniref:hypothetical protein n=1 Tax=Streptomyces sp. NPDC085929 TaxID=3365739 RepID=UPI0037CE24CC
MVDGVDGFAGSLAGEVAVDVRGGRQGGMPQSLGDHGHIGNLAATNLDQLARAVKRSLKQIQYRPHLVDGCLAATGLILDG